MQVPLPKSEQAARLIPMAQSVLDRIRLTIDSDEAIRNLSRWQEAHLNLTEDTPMSFIDHEMQIDIVNDTSARQVTRKCSQVGLTTLYKMKALSLAIIGRATHIIYAGPTTKWVSKFVKTEIKPAIDSSPILKTALGVDSVEVIGLGSSFIHFGGTSDEKSGAISVPASVVLIDELDFCKLKVVTAYESRFKHAKSDKYNRKGTWIKFCTATLPDFGIDKEFKDSDQKYYDVECSACGEWVTPDYFRDMILPGYNCKEAHRYNLAKGKPLNLIANLTPEILDQDISGTSGIVYDEAPKDSDGRPQININGAYLRCNSCHEKQLLNPKFREREADLEELIGFKPGLNKAKKAKEEEEEAPRLGWSAKNQDLWKDLIVPSRRKWRAKNPGHIVSGRHVSPWDVPKVNNIPSILMSMRSYRDNIANYYNFTLGIPYADASNSFLLSGFSDNGFSDYLPVNKILKALDPAKELAGYLAGRPVTLCLGCDVGKTSNIAVGYKTKGGVLHVLWMERFKSSQDKLLEERLLEIIKGLNIRSTVIDSAPDFSTIQKVSKVLKVGQSAPEMPKATGKRAERQRMAIEAMRKRERKVMGCEYKNTVAVPLSNVDPKPEDNLVKAARTGTLSDLLKLHNDGKIMYPSNEGVDCFGSKNIGGTVAGKGEVERELDEMKLNFSNTKKLIAPNADGEDTERFVKSGPDHYAHTVNYLNIAADSLVQLGAAGVAATVAGTAKVEAFNTQGQKPSKVLGSRR